MRYLDSSLLIHCTVKSSRTKLQTPNHPMALELLDVIRKRVPDALQVPELVAFAILDAVRQRHPNILPFRVSSVQISYVSIS